MNAITRTATDLASALTMRPRRRSVSEIVREVFGSDASRRAHQQRRMTAMWAGRELNITDREMTDQFGYSEIQWNHAHDRVNRLRAERADWKALTDAVMAKLEDE